MDHSRMLVLLDIDGTLLLTSDPLYGAALVEAVHVVYGLELSADSLRRVDHPGETAMSGLRLLLRTEGLDEDTIGRDLRRWCELHGRLYVRLLGEATTGDWEAAPQVEETLESLAREHRVALLTGNAAPIAWARMERMGLARFFPPGQGAFGCEAEDRAELIGIARRRAGAWPTDDAVHVGDTPKDIAGARAAGIAAIGIATGRFSRDELADADEVVGRFADLPDAVHRISGGAA